VDLEVGALELGCERAVHVVIDERKRPDVLCECGG
jgi:hypothetical protein